MKIETTVKRRFYLLMLHPFWKYNFRLFRATRRKFKIFFFLLQYLQSFQLLNWKDLHTSLIPQTNTPGSSMPSSPSTKNFCLASDLSELEAPGDERSLGIPLLDDD